MKKPLRNKRFDFLFSIVGFVFSAVLLSYGLVSFILEQSEKVKAAEGISLSGQSSNLKYDSNEQTLFRLALITTCFLVSILISRFTQKAFFRVINFLFLSIISIQSYYFAKEGVSAIQDGWYLGIEYSGIDYIIRGLVLLIYVGGLMLLPAILVMLIQIRFLWGNSRQTFDRIVTENLSR